MKKAINSLRMMGVKHSVSEYDSNNRKCLRVNILGHKNHKLSFLGKIQPAKLKTQFDIAKLGTLRTTVDNPTKIVSTRYIGMKDVVGLSTTTSTYIAEGFGCHNSKFDLPFILARAMVHDITFTYRFPVGYDKNHADLRDILTEGSLDYWATLILGETKNGSGADVAGLVEENKWDEISTYCEHDVALTVKIWERMKNATKGLSK